MNRLKYRFIFTNKTTNEKKYDFWRLLTYDISYNDLEIESKELEKQYPEFTVTFEIVE